jgi:Predicted hydrolases of HD superfamily
MEGRHGVTDDRLTRQIAFIAEIDRLKGVYRQTWLNDGSRHDNSAEHSWHFAVAAFVLAEYAPTGVDMYRVIKMALIHDIVEIDAGDSFVYDTVAAKGKADRERQAADRIFGMLPAEQSTEMRLLWEEFESRQTPDAKFAAALDRIEPILHNYYTKGGAWKEHGVKASNVIEVNSRIGAASEKLWEFILGIIEECIAKGYLEDDRTIEKRSPA